MSLTLALAQINPTVGDIDGNAVLILAAWKNAAAQHADVVICPELSLIGYPPEDLIEMPAFRRKAMDKAHELAEKTANGPALIIGSVWEEKGAIYNAALLLADGKILHIQPKTMLPNYGVFDEKRLFHSGSPQSVEWCGHRLGIMICEDMWYESLAADYKKQQVELLIVINASPFEAGKLTQRHEVAAKAVAEAGVPLVYVNTVGGQDDLVFDGGSFVMSAQGKVVLQMAEFEEEVLSIKCTVQSKTFSFPLTIQRSALNTQYSLWRAMMLGLRDYVQKNGFSGVVLGLSGGIDSAVSAAVAVDALGAAHVKGVLLPSPYTSHDSTDDALETAALLGIETMTVPITPGMEIFDETLNPLFDQKGWMENPLLGGNVQARLRGMILMAISNRFGWMLLSTGNKSELAVGYSTLYGDSCGGYNVLKDLYKTQVYALAHWRNAQEPIAIPERSISKAPSAELAPGQKDADQLPPYELLDEILFHHIELRQSPEEIIAHGFTAGLVNNVVRMVRISEYKRRQSCPGVKLSPMLFGKDRRYPLTNKF